MQIPNISSDECAKGYIGKFMRLNGVKSIPVLRRLLADVLPTPVIESTTNSLSHIFAKLLRVDLQRFVHEHTLMPFLRAVHGESVGIAHGTGSTQHQLMVVGTALPSRHARLCKECIRDDLSLDGVAYWRRYHQLPGVVLCKQHGSGLLLVEADAMLAGLPTDFERSARTVDGRILIEARQNPTIQRYVNICNAFLQTKHPVHPRQAAARLSARARHKGLRVSQIGARPNLSDSAVATLGGHWLDEFFACLKGKASGAFLGKIDGVCTSKHQSYHASSYALALAILWDSPDDALADFLDSSPKAIRAPNWSIEDSVNSVHEHNIRGGVTLPSSARDDLRFDVELAMKSFVAGSSLSDACQKHGVKLVELECSLRAVTARLARAGTALQR